MIDAGFAISEIKVGLWFREAGGSDYFSGFAPFT